MVAIGRLVMSTRERICAIEIEEGGLVLTTLRTAEEVRALDEVALPELPKPDPKINYAIVATPTTCSRILCIRSSGISSTKAKPEMCLNRGSSRASSQPRARCKLPKQGDEPLKGRSSPKSQRHAQEGHTVVMIGFDQFVAMAAKAERASLGSV